MSVAEDAMRLMTQPYLRARWDRVGRRLRFAAQSVAEWEAWRDETRATLRRLTGYDTMLPTPPNPRLTGEEDLGDYVRQHLEIDTEPGVVMTSTPSCPRPPRPPTGGHRPARALLGRETGRRRRPPDGGLLERSTSTTMTMASSSSAGGLPSFAPTPAALASARRRPPRGTCWPPPASGSTTWPCPSGRPSRGCGPGTSTG